MQRVLCLIYLLSNVGTIMGESTQSFKDAVGPIARECMPEIGATEDDFQNVLHRNQLETRTAKCLLACVYKNLNAFTDEGLLVNGDELMPIMSKLYGFHDFTTIMRTQAVHNCINEVNGAHEDQCELVKHFLYCVTQHY
ncbi:general odorant-binding protein 19d-like [Periplaneta americana]|uniref:general odorant-binding protein 19d-like n=1 Tax=Periplaneta americana TaxID=6978 RepID=UPI0037E9658E